MRFSFGFLCRMILQSITCLQQRELELTETGRGRGMNGMEGAEKLTRGRNSDRYYSYLLDK